MNHTRPRCRDEAFHRASCCRSRERPSMRSGPAQLAVPPPAGPVTGSGPGTGVTGVGAEEPAVLVTGSGGTAGIAVIRRLVALGHRVVAADSDWGAAGGALAHAAVTVPRADHPRFLDAVLGMTSVYQVDALISTVAEELPALTAGVARLGAAGVATWLPPLDAVDLCCDKAAFAERLAEVGSPIRRRRPIPPPLPGSRDRGSSSRAPAGEVGGCERWTPSERSPRHSRPILA